MNYQPINFKQKLGLFSEQWQPRVIAEIEPRGTLNTGHEGGERTAANDIWI